MIEFIVSIIVSALIGSLLYWLGKRGKGVWFTVVLGFAAVAPITLFGLAILLALGQIYALIIALFVIAYLYLWGLSLYEAAGDGTVAWFVLIYLISPLWVVYQVVE